MRFEVKNIHFRPSPINGGAICNMLAFEVLHSVFERATDDDLRWAVADAVLQIFKRDNANYFIAQPVNHCCDQRSTAP